MQQVTIICGLVLVVSMITGGVVLNHYGQYANAAGLSMGGALLSILVVALTTIDWN